MGVEAGDATVEVAEFSPAADTSGAIHDSIHGLDEFVEQHPDSTFFHVSAWSRLVARHFPHRPRTLVARRGGRIVGVLPLFATRSPLTGSTSFH